MWCASVEVGEDTRFGRPPLIITCIALINNPPTPHLPHHTTQVAARALEEGLKKVFECGEGTHVAVLVSSLECALKTASEIIADVSLPLNVDNSTQKKHKNSTNTIP